MEHRLREVKGNFESFRRRWKEELLQTSDELDEHGIVFERSYTRLVSLQAWRNHLQTFTDGGNMEFLLECQNDALTGHVLASLGSWRAALKSLRGCIDSATYFLYYKDHAVEMSLWERGKHSLGFSELYRYLCKHPLISDLDRNLTGLALLKREYSTLSRAVHGSSRSFRMTLDSGTTRLWSSERPRLNAWDARERQVILSLNLLFLALFNTRLRGAAYLSLRKAISLAIPTSRHEEIKEHFGVTLLPVDVPQ